MAETITLTTPVTKPSVTLWRFSSVNLQVLPEAKITIVLVDNTNTYWEAQYTDTPESIRQATPMLKVLNTANLSTKSLHRRILETLMADFPSKFTGSISGVPDV